jgi:hypothetical protein
LFIKEWAKMTSDPYILDMVQGAHIQFKDGMPSRINNNIKPYPMSQSERLVVDKEIEKLVDKGVLRQVKPDECMFMSNVFLRPKKNGTYRLILNLKELNEDIEYSKFKMETLHSIVKLMRPNCFMASLDLSDAYYSVPVAPEHQLYLCFPWVNQAGVRSIYAYTCLPNGLTSAPRDFTKLLKPPLAKLRLEGVTIAAYIDDTYIQGSDAVECTSSVYRTKEVLESLGFVLNMEKSVFSPSQQLTMLGFILDSTTMTVRPTQEKVDTIRALCQEKRTQAQCTIRDLAKLIGNLVALFPGAEYGPLHYRKLEKLKSKELNKQKGNFNKQVELTDDIHEDLDWWIDNVQTVYRVIDHGHPHITMRTDASKSGWGATVTGVTTGGRWTDIEAEEHINYLELLAAFFGLKSLCQSHRNCHVRLQLDNTTAVCYINSMGGTVSARCNDLAKEIWDWCTEREIWLSAAHIPGKHNVEADKASRKFNDRTEWQLDPAVFLAVTQKLHVSLDIDLFATRLNTQLPCYVSWQPDPEAAFIDAFSVTWSDYNAYLFPPFSMINRCVQKLSLEKSRGLLIVPLWPNQCWFTPLMNLLIDCPVILPKSSILPPMNPSATLPPGLRLLACHVSGENSEVMAFQNQLQKSYYQAGGQIQNSSMTGSLVNGMNFVVNGRLLVMKHLYQKY